MDPAPPSPHPLVFPKAATPRCSSTMAVGADPHFHVLAVDDSLVDRKLIERLLKTSSYQVTAVESVSKALEFLGLVEDSTDPKPPVPPEVDVNLIITDYCMPGMTGYDLLKRIKESSLLKDIPVVIMSSENVPSRINRCLEGGADEFFIKPVQLSDVKRLRPHLCRSKNLESNKSRGRWKPLLDRILSTWTTARQHLPAWSLFVLFLFFFL
ncbi:hypothetical protein HPP92_016700 [Vanilla planifolia]|uniref:Response regulatory domain-containing protein n=1 Tax=Vanilla planifolia TaxID=51239 RepID=A0A835QM02_VANPL|nr:hypothetical protein HPP92_016700 [Vanilla planifolia]